MGADDQSFHALSDNFSVWLCCNDGASCGRTATFSGVAGPCPVRQKPRLPGTGVDSTPVFFFSPALVEAAFGTNTSGERHTNTRTYNLDLQPIHPEPPELA